MWDAWTIDHQTVGWVLWAVFFVAWEAYTGLLHPGQMLTDHLRPLFSAAPILWFVGVGLWLWVGLHLLLPGVEQRLITFVREVT